MYGAVLRTYVWHPMERIHTDGAPTPAGHYSQAVVPEGLVLVVGQLPTDAASVQTSDPAVAVLAQ